MVMFRHTLLQSKDYSRRLLATRTAEFKKIPEHPHSSVLTHPYKEKKTTPPKQIPEISTKPKSSIKKETEKISRESLRKPEEISQGVELNIPQSKPKSKNAVKRGTVLPSVNHKSGLSAHLVPEAQHGLYAQLCYKILADYGFNLNTTDVRDSGAAFMGKWYLPNKPVNVYGTCIHSNGVATSLKQKGGTQKDKQRDKSDGVKLIINNTGFKGVVGKDFTLSSQPTIICSIFDRSDDWLSSKSSNGSTMRLNKNLHKQMWNSQGVMIAPARWQLEKDIECRYNQLTQGISLLIFNSAFNEAYPEIRAGRVVYQRTEEVTALRAKVPSYAASTFLLEDALLDKKRQDLATYVRNEKKLQELRMLQLDLENQAEAEFEIILSEKLEQERLKEAQLSNTEDEIREYNQEERVEHVGFISDEQEQTYDSDRCEDQFEHEMIMSEQLDQEKSEKAELWNLNTDKEITLKDLKEHFAIAEKGEHELIADPKDVGDHYLAELEETREGYLQASQADTFKRELSMMLEIPEEKKTIDDLLDNSWDPGYGYYVHNWEEASSMMFKMQTSFIHTLAETPTSAKIPMTPSSAHLPMTPSSAHLPMTSSSAHLPMTPSSAHLSMTPTSAHLPMTPSSAHLPMTPSSAHLPMTLPNTTSLIDPVHDYLFEQALYRMAEHTPGSMQLTLQDQTQSSTHLGDKESSTGDKVSSTGDIKVSSTGDGVSSTGDIKVSSTGDIIVSSTDDQEGPDDLLQRERLFMIELLERKAEADSPPAPETSQFVDDHKVYQKLAVLEDSDDMYYNIILNNKRMPLTYKVKRFLGHTFNFNFDTEQRIMQRHVANEPLDNRPVFMGSTPPPQQRQRARNTSSTRAKQYVETRPSVRFHSSW